MAQNDDAKSTNGQSQGGMFQYTTLAVGGVPQAVVRDFGMGVIKDLFHPRGRHSMYIILPASSFLRTNLFAPKTRAQPHDQITKKQSSKEAANVLQNACK